MLKIRLQRCGKNKKPVYRVVVAESSCPRDGKYVAIIGQYNPLLESNKFTIKEDLFKKYYQNGAQLTDRVQRLCKINNLI